MPYSPLPYNTLKRALSCDPAALLQIVQLYNASYNKVTVEDAAASRVFFHLKAEAVRMGE